MKCYAIGAVMRDARRRHGMTQEELAFGICSVSTLSKIENGVRTPQIRTFEALMQRMGEPGNMYISYAGEGKLRRRELVREMEQAVRLKQVEKIRQLLKEYDAVPGKESILEQQERRLIAAVLRLRSHTPVEDIYRELKEILTMTRPDFDKKQMSDALYTDSEVLLLQVIAYCCQKMGQQGKAFSILDNLLCCQKKNFSDEGSMGDVEASIYYQLADLHLQMRQYASSDGFCTKGIRKCLQTERYHFLSILLAQRARIMAELGDTGEAHLANLHAGLLDEILANQKYLSKFM